MKMLNFGENAAALSIGISPNGDYAFIANRAKNSVSAMNLFGEQKFSLSGTYTLENAPGEIAFLPSEVNVTKYKTESNIDTYWDSNRPSVIYFQELADVSDEEFFKEIETPFLFVLTEDDMEEYEALADVASKKDFIKIYINEKDENPVYPVNYWFLEYSGRVAYAQENYSLRKPPYIDDRGKFYIRYGPPSQKHIDRGGFKKHEFIYQYKYNKGSKGGGNSYEEKRQAQWETKIELAKIPPDVYITIPNETWTYYFDKGFYFTVYFAVRGYFKELRNGLAGILETKKRTDVSWYWMDLVKERFHLSSDHRRRNPVL